MLKNKNLLLILIVVLILIAGGVFLYARNYNPEAPGQTELNPNQCEAMGGEVVNILDDKRAEDLEFRQDHKPEFCKTQADYLGDVTGLHCPCVCCKK